MFYDYILWLSLICIYFRLNDSKENSTKCATLSFDTVNNSMSTFPMFARSVSNSVENCALQCYNLSICFASNFVGNRYCELMSTELDGPYDNTKHKMLASASSTYIHSISCQENRSKSSSRKRRSAGFDLQAWIGNHPTTAEPFAATKPSSQSRTGSDLGFACGIPKIQSRVSSSALTKNLFRIVGGYEATPHSVPWQASLQTAASFHFCGGTLIHPKYVLTAGHCVQQYSMSEIRVVLGAHDRSIKEPEQIKLTVSDIAVHPDYEMTKDAIYNDFAVLTLSERINLTDYVSPVCINSWSPPAGVQCIVSGWGTTLSGSTITSQVLRQVVIPLYNNSQCNDAKHYHGLIDDSAICAGLDDGGKDSCQGDSGGPLSCFDSVSNKWYQIGVVSYGEDCALVNKPGVYARVAYGFNWIIQQLK